MVGAPEAVTLPCSVPVLASLSSTLPSGFASKAAIAFTSGACSASTTSSVPGGTSKRKEPSALVLVSSGAAACARGKAADHAAFRGIQLVGAHRDEGGRLAVDADHAAEVGLGGEGISRRLGAAGAAPPRA